MSGRYASGTKVSPAQSRIEIEQTLSRYGATQFIYGWDEETGTGQFGFRMHGRMVRFKLMLPDRESDEFVYTDTGRMRSDSAMHAAWEQAVRQRWRAMALVIKAKLEAIESGIVSFEQEFLAQIMLADGQTVGDWVEPQIREVYQSGTMPDRLPGLDASALTSGGA